MVEIVPAIIARDIEEVKQKLALIEGAVTWAQIDVMDGVFTPPVTFNDPAALRDVTTTVRLEVHLMVARPENSIDAWLDSPVARILVHYESTTPAMVHEMIRRGEKKGKEVGIALKFETPISILDDFFAQHPSLRFIQLMGIAEIGYHGHPFEVKTLEKISALRAQHPDGILEVDGGVSAENISRIAQAGASRIVAGSAIFKTDDPKRAYRELVRLAENTEI
ncbi:MAG: hypothetical protein NUV61_03705 [Candidatus Azambacteria bacterium]|nr:hypothetical protein [Candidatus Azambacteria bacterium]